MIKSSNCEMSAELEKGKGTDKDNVSSCFSTQIKRSVELNVLLTIRKSRVPRGA